jgi:hypothetical protein
MRLSFAGCLPASEKRQGTKSRGRYSDPTRTFACGRPDDASVIGQVCGQEPFYPPGRSQTLWISSILAAIDLLSFTALNVRRLFTMPLARLPILLKHRTELRPSLGQSLGRRKTEGRPGSGVGGAVPGSQRSARWGRPSGGWLCLLRAPSSKPTIEPERRFIGAFQTRF